MKKIFGFIISFLIAFLFMGCNQEVTQSVPTATAQNNGTSSDKPGFPRVQLSFTSFEELKEFALLIGADDEAVVEYADSHSFAGDPFLGLEILSKRLDIQIPCADAFPESSVEWIYMTPLDEGIAVWYYIGDYRFLFDISPYSGDWKTDQEIRAKYEAENVLYRSETSDRITYLHEYVPTERSAPGGLYDGEIFFDETCVWVSIFRIYDEETGEFQDGGNVDVDPSLLEQFHFMPLGELLDSIE